MPWMFHISSCWYDNAVIAHCLQRCLYLSLYSDKVIQWESRGSSMGRDQRVHKQQSRGNGILWQSRRLWSSGKIPVITTSSIRTATLIFALAKRALVHTSRTGFTENWWGCVHLSKWLVTSLLLCWRYSCSLPNCWSSPLIWIPGFPIGEIRDEIYRATTLVPRYPCYSWPEAKKDLALSGFLYR